jgi:chromosome partitioning protein
MGPKQKTTLGVIDELSASFTKMIDFNKKQVLADGTTNGKLKRSYNQREVRDITGIHFKKLKDICKNLGIETAKNGSKWQVDIDELYQISKEFGTQTFKRSRSQPLQVFTTSQLKGGSGKTVTTVTLATGVATELSAHYRVGVIDLDTQGTASMFLKPNLSENELSVGDLLMKKYRSNADETFDSICKEAFYPTNVPNLRVLCCRPDDREYEYNVITSQYEATKGNESYNAYQGLQDIIAAVEDEFDIIFIDTAPQFSALTIAGHYVATSLIIPMRPSESDRDSSDKYFDFLSKMMRLLIGLGHPGMDSIKLLITALRTQSAAQLRMAQTIRKGCNSDNMFTHDFVESDAVLNCAEDLCTVFDMSVSEYPASKLSLKLAQQAYTNILFELERLILKHWGIMNNG